MASPPGTPPRHFQFRTRFYSADETNNHFQTPGRPGFLPAHWTPAAPSAPVFQPPPPPRQTMPGPHDRSAPKFDGHPLSLKRFFDEFEILAKNCRLTDQEKIQHILRYLEWKEYEIWKSQAAAQGKDWDSFRRNIMALYPGADEDRKYTVVDLEILADRQAREPMRSRYQYGEYYRNFVTIAEWLWLCGEISRRERDTLFLNGFDPSFKQKVLSRLQIKYPDHPLHQPWRIEDVHEAARYFLSANSASSEPGPYPVIATPPQPLYTTPALIEPPRETFDISSIEQLIVSDAFVSKLAGKLGLGNQGNPSANHQSNPFPRRPRIEGCIGCLDPSHTLYHCPSIADYIAKGLCKRDATNRVVLPDGTFISAQVAPGRCIKEKIDNYYKMKGAPTIATNIVEAILTPPAHQYHYSIPPTIEEPVESNMNEITIQELEELRLLDSVAVSSLKRADELRKRVENAAKGKANAGVNTRNSSKAKNDTQPSKNPNPTPQNTSASQGPVDNKANPTSTHTPQFRYTTPIEDPNIVQQVIQKGLDSPVTLTQRELLAISPDVRRFVKDQVTTKRIPTNTSAVTKFEEAIPDEPIESFINHSPHPPGLVVANTIEDLRIIDLTVEGKVNVEAILDEGSQIIGIRRDIWEKIGVAMRSDQLMVMESANSSRDSTIGLLPNLKVSIGNCDFYLQVQVVENASYEMLLGRPFLTLTQASTRHFSNGDSHITLVDPNTHSIITIPTKPRVRRTQSGFQ